MAQFPGGLARARWSREVTYNMQVRSARRPVDAPSIACPDDGCTDVFACEACLNEHLKGEHDTRYSDVHGTLDERWAEFCPAHAAYTAPML